MVCYVTERKSLDSAEPAREVLARIRIAIEAGTDWVQIREKDLPGRELLALARGAVGATKSAVRVIVNDRLDVALAAGAAGVHLGGESLPAAEVVRWCRNGNAPAGFMVGVSCHSIEAVREAEAARASYVFFGPMFATPSKAAFGAPQGIARVAEVCASVRIPVIAIGGVNETNGAECLRAGAAGVAAIRMFQQARDTETLAEKVASLHRAGRS